MYTKQERPGLDGFWTGLLILGVGLAVGLLLRPERWGLPRAEEGAVERRAELQRFLVPAAETPPAAENGLETLALTIPAESARVLQAVRDRAMERGVIIQTDADTVPAQVALGDGDPLAAEVRIKGDWLDHVGSDKWSLRIKLEDGKLAGMRTFSIQAPHTRGVLWEWLVLEAARRLDVLAPRCDFVNVVLNGNPAGIYYLEEHFAKELLEAQGRREGPIVLWDESTYWTTLLETHGVGEAESRMLPPRPLAGARDVTVAPVRAYGEKRLQSIESLRRTLYDAVEEMHDLRVLGQSKTSLVDRIGVLHDLLRVEGKLLGDIVDMERLTRAHALASLFQIKHALSWHNLRFYHNPVLDRLEPIMFDNMAHVPAERVPVMYRATGLVKEFSRNARYYEGVFRHLGEICEPAWLDALFAEVEPDLRRFEAALAAERALPIEYRVDAMKQRLRAQQGFLQQILYPDDPLNAEAFYEVDGGADEVLSGALEVRVWATTRSPVVVEGFRFGNGSFVVAEPYLSAGRAWCTFAETGVILPHQGTQVTFRFPIDERLASLESAREIKQSVRRRENARASLDLDIDLVFRSLAADEVRSEALRFRRFDRAWALERGRPALPEVSVALARHPFLERALETGDLRVRKGEWDVAGDLVVPAGKALWIPAGTRLRFQAGACLLSESPLNFEGGPDAPIVLEPVEGAATWRGVVVLNAHGRSTWKHTSVRQTDAISRAGWVLTGGVTFYHSPVTLIDCTFAGSRGEDALNVFASDLALERVTFVDFDSDGFDGDFVTGTVVGCTFRDGRGDGLDLSGSQVELRNCTFQDVGDKAISIGEESRVRVFHGSIERAGLGIVSKDSSEVMVEGTSIRNVRAFGLAAYTKKAEFGPSRLLATGVTIVDAALGDALAQTGCTVEIDGRPIATVELDVDQLYREGVLGR